MDLDCAGRRRTVDDALRAAGTLIESFRCLVIAKKDLHEIWVQSRRVEAGACDGHRRSSGNWSLEGADTRDRGPNTEQVRPRGEGRLGRRPQRSLNNNL